MLREVTLVCHSCQYKAQALMVLATPFGWLGLSTLSSIACINAGSTGRALHVSKAAAAA